MKENWEFRKSDFGKEPKNKNFGDFELATSNILRARGFSSQKEAESFLNPDYESELHDPWLFGEMVQAVERVLEAKNKKQKVCIFGDYDADGVTSTALLLDFFQQAGIDCFMYIPDRNTEGYGMNKKAIDFIAEQKTKLIITVDCGISNIEEVEHAKESGVDVVILDHHHVPQKIPLAVAIIDPKKEGEKYPEKSLAGVGVAFKFVQALAQKLKKFDKEQLKWLLDLVAIGTVADCVPLLGENRVLVKYGLIVLGKTKRVGLRQLFHVGRIAVNEHAYPTSQQISFQIAPRINAAGRMDHANTALHLLACKQTEEAKARILALEIEDKNKHRQKVTQEIIKEVDLRMAQKKRETPLIIEHSQFWEFGVIGLAAGKTAEKYGRPTILLQKKEGFFRGSGRSIAGVNMIEIIERNQNLLNRFGGHAQALGLEVSEKNFPQLEKKLLEEFSKVLPDGGKPKILIDTEIEFSQIKEKLLSELSFMEPFGQGNEKPLFFSGKVVIVEKKIIGNGEKHLKLWLGDHSKNPFILELIGFGMAEEFSDLKKGDKLNIIYRLEIDEWNGFRKIKGILEDIEKI